MTVTITKELRLSYYTTINVLFASNHLSTLEIIEVNTTYIKCILKLSSVSHHIRWLIFFFLQNIYIFNFQIDPRINTEQYAQSKLKRVLRKCA